MTPITDKGWEIYHWYNKWLIFPLVALMYVLVLAFFGYILFRSP
jgi:hypothetical protein